MYTLVEKNLGYLLLYIVVSNPINRIEIQPAFQFQINGC